MTLIILYITCRRNDDEKNILEVDPDDDFIRENVMFYDEEGAGMSLLGGIMELQLKFNF